MRTTITLDDDVVEKLRTETLQTGRSFKETVNDVIRLGIVSRSLPRQGEGLHPGRELVGQLTSIVCTSFRSGRHSLSAPPAKLAVPFFSPKICSMLVG
ncbi:MAG: hypothetical protein ACKVVP_09180 [Chloroflexota bacterium]